MSGDTQSSMWEEENSSSFLGNMEETEQSKETAKEEEK